MRQGLKLLMLGMVIPPLIGNPCNRYIKPYHSVDDHLLEIMGVQTHIHEAYGLH